MHVDVMRTIDRFAGIPLCWVTGARHRLLPASRDRLPEPDRPVLVMKMFGTGSVLLSAPLLHAIREHYPRAPLAYLTFAGNREIVEHMPAAAVRLTIDPSHPSRFLSTTIRTLFAISRLRPRIVFDLEFFSKFSTFIAAVSGAPIRVGFDLPTRWRRWNITHPVVLNHREHVSIVFLRQMEAIGGAMSPFAPPLPLEPTDSDRAELDRTLASSRGREIIAVNVNAGQTSLDRRWPAERFGEAVKQLAEMRPETRFCFTGLAAERDYVAQVIAPLELPPERVVNCAGQLNLGGLLALLDRSALLITNDTGPMHIAASVGTPVVALFGPESPAFYGPLGNARVLYKSLACSPCLTVYNAKQFTCPFEQRCMRDIAVADVVAAAGELLRQPVIPEEA